MLLDDTKTAREHASSTSDLKDWEPLVQLTMDSLHQKFKIFSKKSLNKNKKQFVQG